MSVRAKLLMVAGLVLIVIATGVVFGLENFTRNNPRFCMGCHLLASPHSQWERSVHQDINCHDCHRLSFAEINRLILGIVIDRSVPGSHGKAIAPWRSCTLCHWEKSDESSGAPLSSRLNDSALHARHFFQEKIECPECHGYNAHLFLPDERFCIRCHTGIDVHAGRMEALACLNCHTDTRADMRPDRLKCLYCHGTDRDRAALMASRGSSPDVRFFTPSGDIVNSAPRINVPVDAPMRFDCYLCHKPHGKVRPDWGRCGECHSSSLATGRHAHHVELAGMACIQCHRPHTWTVTVAQSRILCSGCHEYRTPEQFLK